MKYILSVFILATSGLSFTNAKTSFIDALADGGTRPILLTLFLLLVYFLPTIFASVRKNKVASVFVINFFLGWTFIAWVIALAMAVSNDNRKKKD